MIRRQFTVYGKVQGVWFRASTREQALALGLSGFASNLADGSVRVEAQGDKDALDHLEQWLRHGPPLAKVTKLVVEDIELSPTVSGFLPR